MEFLKVARLVKTAVNEYLKPFSKHMTDQQVLDNLTLLTQNPGKTPSDLHNEWCVEMYAQGWKRGDNASLKMRPDLVPFSELPECKRVSATLFYNVVQTFI